MKHTMKKQMQEKYSYLEATFEQYPNIQSAAAEMINLHAILICRKVPNIFFRYSR